MLTQVSAKLTPSESRQEKKYIAMKTRVKLRGGHDYFPVRVCKTFPIVEDSLIRRDPSMLLMARQRVVGQPIGHLSNEGD